MKSSYRIFRIRGIDVSLHITLLMMFILPVLDLFSYGNLGEGVASAVYSFAFLTALFVSVFFHELAHSLVAIRSKIEVKQIILTPIGGISTIGMMRDAMTELKISLAGPLTSLAIGFVLLLIMSATVGLSGVSKTIASGKYADTPSLFNFAVLGMYINLILGVFNLFLPIFPMDGGRVLRSLLCLITNRVKATKIAVWIGQSFLSVFLVLALMAGSIWLIIIAVFLFFAGISELRITELSEGLKKADLKRAVFTSFITLHPNLKITDFLGIMVPRQSIYPIVDGNGKPIGVVDGQKVAKKEGKKEGVVSDVMSAVFPKINLDSDKGDILASVYSNGYSFVIDKQGLLKGIMTMQNLQNVLKEEG